VYLTLIIFDDAWHEMKNGAAKVLFGFNSWKEVKLYVVSDFLVAEPESLIALVFKIVFFFWMGLTSI